MIDLIPSLATLVVIGLFVARQKGMPVIQVFISIVAGYVVVFPAIDFYLAPDPPLATFAYHQILLALFFIFPLLFFSAHRSSLHAGAIRREIKPVSLNLIAPVFLMLCAILFVFIAFRYDLYLVRLNYTAYNVTTDAPTLFLGIYRIILESSFFVILFLIYCIKASVKTDTLLPFYRAVLITYFVIFAVFFFVNSRMQFLILAIIMAITFYKPGQFSNKQIFALVGAVVPLAIALTLLRELYIEEHDRLDVSSTGTLLRETILLLSGRLNSVIMLNRAGEFGYGFSPFSIDLSGLWYFVQLNTAFFTDPELYADLRGSQITSPSVYVINSIMFSNYVDFPKAMVVDVFLTFGVYGLPVLAYILATFVVFIQQRLRNGSIADAGFVVALYVLPLVFQFEKEFLGFLTFLLKWSPMLLALVVLRPKEFRAHGAISSEPQRA